jgi:hypothetical protein
MRIYGPDDTVLNGTWQVRKPTHDSGVAAKS